MNYKNLSTSPKIDYQLKKEELIKELIFLQKYSQKGMLNNHEPDK